MKIKSYKNTLLRFLVANLLLCSLLLSACGTKSKYSGKNLNTGQKVAKTAHTQIGKKYVFGGESPQRGFDCSGLIWWAYGKHGISVPRVTTDQAKTGQSVPSTRAKPGDIVVFRTSSSGTGLHTGIYLGADKFIHSPRTGAHIRIESIKSSYWKPKLTAVRRVVN